MRVIASSFSLLLMLAASAVEAQSRRASERIVVDIEIVGVSAAAPGSPPSSSAPSRSAPLGPCGRLGWHRLLTYVTVQARVLRVVDGHWDGPELYVRWLACDGLSLDALERSLRGRRFRGELRRSISARERGWPLARQPRFRVRTELEPLP